MYTTAWIRDLIHLKSSQYSFTGEVHVECLYCTVSHMSLMIRLRSAARSKNDVEISTGVTDATTFYRKTRFIFGRPTKISKLVALLATKDLP